MTPPVGIYALPVNGKAINVPISSNLFEALRRSPSVSRMSELLNPDARPLYVFDGLEIQDGLGALERVPVCDAESVELLRPIQAVALYGEKASAGAIVVKTRRGGGPRANC